MSNSQYFPGGKNSGEAPERSNFAQIRYLLSQNIKEEVSPRDINLGTNGKLEPTERSPTTTMNLLTNMGKSGQASTQSMNDSSSKPATREPKTAQMTIFYAGKMLVFDDFPAEKVSEIVLLASKGSSPNTAAVSTSADPKIEHGHGAMNSIASASSNPTQGRLQPQFNGQKTKASLHRFFEKRKDRAIARAPYQVLNPSPSSPKHEEQFDLNL